MSEMKKIYITGLWLLCIVYGVSAQTYDIIERRNSWNTGKNVTGIRMDSISSSYAELYGKNNHGDFHHSYEAEKSWNAGAIAKSITHLKGYSLTGSFSFDHTSGKDMSGSMFIQPGFYPVDILEFTPGRKDLQRYAFMGGIASDIAPNWRLGGKIDFAASNYSKRKDLRHTNYRLDLKVAPSVMYHSGDLAIGFSYMFSKNSESVKAEVIGTTENSYNAFLDKGLMYGAYEAWDGSGIHLSESGINGFPIKELSNGGALQLQWKRFYGDIEYTYSSGSAGERDAFSVHPEYEFISPRTEVRLGTHISTFKRLTTQMYPYVASEKMLCTQTYVSSVFHIGKFDLKAAASFAIGNSTEKSRVITTDTEPGDPPYRLTDYYNLQNEYATAPQATLRLGLRYHFNHGIYAEVQGSYTRGFNLHYIDGSSRWNETIKLGYTF